MCILCQSASDFFLRHGVPADGTVQPSDTAPMFMAAEYLPAAASPSVASVAGTHGSLSSNQMIDGILYDGWKFDFGNNPHFISYAFVDDNGHSWNDAAINGPNARAAYETGLALWQNVAQLQFVLTTNATAADFNEHLMNQAQIGAGTNANHQLPDAAPGVTGNYSYEHPASYTQFVGSTPIPWGGNWSDNELTPGGYAQLTFIHELGHGLGLKHPFDIAGNAQKFPGVVNSNDLGANNLNHMFWTVMSYNDAYNFDADGRIQINAGNPQVLTDALGNKSILTDYGYAAGPMAFDIAALQYLYGANAPFHQNDDVYVLPDANQAGTRWYCIWDTGGNDTIEYNGTKNVIIDLTPATLDNTATGGGVLSYAANVRGGFTIAGDFMNVIADENGVTGVIIENARSGSGNDTLTGNDADNVFYGGRGIDTIDGRGGQDTADYSDTTQGVIVRLQGISSGIITIPASASGVEIDTDYLTSIENVWGGSGADTMYGGDGTNVMRGNGGNDILYASLGDDTLDGGPGFDTADYSGALGNEYIDLRFGGAIGYFGLDALTSIEKVIAGYGNDRLVSGSANETLDGGAGIDTLELPFTTQSVTVILGPHQVGQFLVLSGEAFGAEIGNDTVLNIENVITGNGADTLAGDGWNNVFTPGAGNDTLDGGGGRDTVDYSATTQGITVFTGPHQVGQNFVLHGTASGAEIGSDDLTSIENVIGGSGIDTLTGWQEDNIFTPGAGNDTVDGAGGIDTVDYSFTTQGITAHLFLGVDQFGNPVSPYATGSEIGYDFLTSIENVIGGSGNDTLIGNNADNVFAPGAGNDTLDGAGGTDTVDYSFTTQGITVYTGGHQVGQVFVQTGAASGAEIGSDSLTSIENVIGGSGGDTLIGWQENNVFAPGAGNDTLDGAGGNDTVDYSTTMGGVTVILGPHQVGQFFLLNGSASGFEIGSDGLTSIENVIGGSGDDIFTGTSGDNTFNGGAGFDTVDYSNAGAAVSVDLGPTTPQNTGGAGTDTLISIEKIIGSNYSDVLLRGFATTVTLMGGNGDDVFHDHNFGNDTFDGGGGTGDTIDYSTGGSDSVIVDLAGSLLGGLAASVGGSVNTLISIENAVGSEGNDQLYGANGQINRLEGRGGDDVLDGRGGADIMIGGLGNDSYFIDDPGDQITENANEGTDTILIATHYTLGTNFENLILLGSADLQGYGNAVANLLVGNAGNNLLNGNGGADTMVGGAGNDTYFFDNASDAASENANEGNDTVFSTVSTTLSTNVETLVLQGSADLQGYGNTQVNMLYGNNGNNLLNGDAGADLMVGGAGNDTYFVDNSSDACFEVAGQGNDAVFSTTHYGLSAEVETLILLGSADLQGYGNNQANTLYGNSGNNLLNGAGGVDLMVGGAGNDTYFVDNSSDACFEGAGQGNDAVFSTSHYGLSADVETLVLVGSADLQGYGNNQVNTLYGNSGNNLLNGAGGADTMIGGAGNDTYFVDNANDVPFENANEGTDSVFASVGFTLTANVEALVLQGTGNINATGNALANSLFGNSGANTLNGGAGADQLTGNLGNDIFAFNAGEAAGDTVVDFAGNGAGAGDSLQFIGYGAGATFTNIDTTHWQINYNGGASHNIITFSNGASIDATDYSFI